jgi:hypothetical protein
VECTRQRYNLGHFYFTGHRCVEKLMTWFRIASRTIKSISNNLVNPLGILIILAKTQKHLSNNLVNPLGIFPKLVNGVLACVYIRARCGLCIGDFGLDSSLPRPRVPLPRAPSPDRSRARQVPIDPSSSRAIKEARPAVPRFFFPFPSATSPLPVEDRGRSRCLSSST